MAAAARARCLLDGDGLGEAACAHTSGASTPLTAPPAFRDTHLLPRPWVRANEWYNFTALPTGISALTRVDESTYTGGTLGPDHPISWQHMYDGGRAWYAAMGHTTCSFVERAFLDHLLGGIDWAAGAP